MPKTAERRDAYPHFAPIATRWMDNDVYGHVNNVVYYAYFDTVINRHLISAGGLDIANGDILGLCVESSCSYLAPVSFPADLEAGLRVAHLGTSSVRYDLAIFEVGAQLASAQGSFVHVFVDRATRRPTPIAGRLRDALAALVRS